MKIKEIKEIVDNYTGLDIATKSNKQPYTNARAIFNYCARRYANEYVSYEMLGETLNCTHATVMNSIKRFYDFIDTEPEFRNLTSQIVDAILEVKKAIPDPKHEVDDLKYTSLRARYYKAKNTIKSQYMQYFGTIKRLNKKLAKLENDNMLLRKKLNKICNYELID